MQNKVLIIEDSRTALNIVVRLVEQAGLVPVVSRTLTEARHVFIHSTPEDFLCAIVDYNLPDSPNGEAIDFCIQSILPTIVVTGRLDSETREDVLRREVVDYIPKENAQTYDYLARLLKRLEHNKQIGVVVAGQDRSTAIKMSSLLRRHNFITHEASTAEETYKLVRDNPEIRVVITGRHFSDEKSTSVISNLRVDYPKERLAIISVSEQEAQLNSARFIKSGANDFLLTPFCHEEFLCRITQNIELIEHVEALTSMANSDFLTGLFNRRYFLNKLSAMAARRSERYSLAVLDLDNFKQVNDTYGHDAGDIVLVHTAAVLRQHFADAVIARFGGEEFCIFMPDISAEHALSRIEALRALVCQQPVQVGEEKIPVSISAGLLTTKASSLVNSISRADKLLYQAKHAGRNRVVSDIAFSRALDRAIQKTA